MIVINIQAPIMMVFHSLGLILLFCMMSLEF